jgi:tRNA pseudouridine55 synthase
VTAHVSKGTYIRSLARDIAMALGTVGHVTMLRRTKAGPFGLESAISLDKLDEIAKGAPLEGFLLPLEAGLDDIPALTLAPDQADRLRVGQMLASSEIVGSTASDDIMLAKTDGGTPLALVEHRDGFIRVVRGFNLSS